MSLPWRTLDRAETPDGELELRQRGEGDFLVLIDGRVLMNSAASRSEEALGRLACERLDRRSPRVLVGGLGMGCTLRAALDALPAEARVLVAELHGVVVDWCRGPLASLSRRALDDPRVRVRTGDVAAPIREAARGAAPLFDAILLDLFSGPHAASDGADHPHYGAKALGRSQRALAPGGVLAVWAEEPDPPFLRALTRAGFSAEQHRPAHGGRRHAVYLARRGGPRRAAP